MSMKPQGPDPASANQLAERDANSGKRGPADELAIGNEGGDRLGSQRAVHERPHALVDGVGGVARQLLEHDGAHKRAEAPVRVGGPVPNGPDGGDHPGERGVDVGHGSDGTGQ